MARPIFCRWCGEESTVIAGILPEACPGCRELGFERPPKWSTEPGQIVKERRQHPRVPYKLSWRDVEFLRTNRIAPE